MIGVGHAMFNGPLPAAAEATAAERAEVAETAARVGAFKRGASASRKPMYGESVSVKEPRMMHPGELSQEDRELYAILVNAQDQDSQEAADQAVAEDDY